jgi:hypothetical protein
MSSYKLYVVDEGDHIIGRLDLDFADDGAAIEYAKRLVLARDIELWQQSPHRPFR